MPTAQSFQLDVTNAEQVLSIFERVRPDAVIHAAGNKDVRFCEDYPDEANRINGLGTHECGACLPQVRGEHDLPFDRFGF